MKIGFDAKRAFFNSRGLGNYSRLLLEGMTQYYPNSTYYLYSPNPKENLDWFNSLKSKNKNSGHAGTILRTPTGYFQKKIPTLWRSLFLAAELEKDNLDIYHGLSHELPLNMPEKKKRSYNQL